MIATAMARLLQGAERALFRTELAVLRSVQSIMMASNRWRVSLRIAPSGSEQCSIPMSRSLKTRRSTRTIFSSEHSTSDFRLIGSLQNPGGLENAEGFSLDGRLFLPPPPNSGGVPRYAAVRLPSAKPRSACLTGPVRPASCEAPRKYLSRNCLLKANVRFDTYIVNETDFLAVTGVTGNVARVAKLPKFTYLGTGCTLRVIRVVFHPCHSFYWS